MLPSACSPVSLPSGLASRGGTTAADAPKGVLAGRRVLVVEDEYFVADDIARTLERAGAEVVGPAPTLADALAHLDRGRIAAAVLDLNLRGEMAWPIVDTLAARGVPFVLATGYDQAAVPVAYRGIPLWEKPFNPENLVRALPGIVPGA